MRTNPALRASDRSYDELVCGQPDGFAAYVDIFPLLVNILYWPTYFTVCKFLLHNILCITIIIKLVILKLVSTLAY